jgi:hypothetical protein
LEDMRQIYVPDLVGLGRHVCRVVYLPLRVYSVTGTVEHITVKNVSP